MDEKTQMHVWVSGLVQGVGFRYYVRQQASDLPISGWVRNVSDGRVEVLAEGERADLETLLAAVQRGPSGSAVTEVAVDWRPAAGRWSKFSISPSE